MRGVFQATIVDSSGAVVPDANIEVRDEVSGDLVQVYEEFEEGEALGNPFTADSEGFTRFYLEDGLYRVTASSGAVERVWRHVHIGIGAFVDSGSFTGTFTGMTAAVTGTINWRRTGTLVTLYTTTGTLGTSNSGSFTITGLPEALQPENLVIVPVAGLVDNFVDHMGAVQISAGSGTLSMRRYDGSLLTNTWTDEGDKGIQGGFQMTYDLES